MYDPKIFALMLEELGNCNCIRILYVDENLMQGLILHDHQS